MMLLSKYQGSMPCVFRKKEDFFMVSLLSLCKLCDPWSGSVLAPVAKFEHKLGRGLLGDATYPITRL